MSTTMTEETVVEFELDYEHQAIRQMVHDFAEKEIAPAADELDEEGGFPYHIVQKMAPLGLFGLPFPEEYGGGGTDILAYALELEELARVYPSIAMTVQASVSLGGFPLLFFGTEAQKQRWLRPLAAGEILGSMGLTEPGAGSDAGATATVAVRDGDDWVIDGSKMFITNSGTRMTGFAVITARTGTRPDGKREISVFLVPNGTPGYMQSKPLKKIGTATSDTRELSFVGCRVPAGNMVGEQGSGFRQLLRVLDDGRVEVAAMVLGIGQGCLDLSLRYAKERNQFDHPISQFQAIQFKLADMATEVELARLMVYKAATLRDQGKPFIKEASMAKLFASEMAQRAAVNGVQIHGGYGYMSEYAISRFYKDVKLFTIVEGTSEVQRMVIARQIGC